MPLQKISLKPGVNRENTRYTNEGGWYESDKVRFRQGTPETIGGWMQYSTGTFLGVCRSLWAWVTLASQKLVGVGTHLKLYLIFDNGYYDITPIRTLNAALGASPFATVSGSPTVTVTHNAHGAIANDFVTFSGATAVAGLTLNAEYQIASVIDVNHYTVTAGANASGTTTGGGAAVLATYQINTGPEIQGAVYGWGAGYWSSGVWSNAMQAPGSTVRIWSQANYGEDLIAAPRRGGVYYWDATAGTGVRAVNLTSMGGATDVPTIVLSIMVSDASRFVFAFGCNAKGSADLDPMLVRWSDQENATMWNPLITNQSGFMRLSNGSEIYAALQMRQEVLVWTDSALYGMQFVGAPLVWGFTMLEANISCIGPNCMAAASGVAYWMGKDKFYKYDGSVKTLRCDLRSYVFDDINNVQGFQVAAGTNEGFNEVWWHYCSSSSSSPDRYVIYNYLEDIWYYGTMDRTAWLDSGLNAYPLAATYANHNIVAHEVSNNNGQGASEVALNASITSSQFDIGDGHNFAFISRLLPDLTFRGSDTGGATPTATFTLLPLVNSGSGYTSPASQGGTNTAPVARIGTYDVDQFTGQVFTRVRGRQMSMQVSSNTLGTKWQLGSPRLDIRPDGRK